MSQINQRLDNILATCEPVMTADRLQNVKILVREIKDILRINGEKNMEDILKGLGLSNLKIFSTTNKDITNEFTLTFRGAEKPQPEPEQKFIITHHKLSEFRGFLLSGMFSYTKNKWLAKQMTLKECSELVLLLQNNHDGNSVFGLLTAPNTDFVQKPPLGIKPHFAYIEDRIKEIDDAIERYNAVSKPIPTNWIKEKEYLQAIKTLL